MQCLDELKSLQICTDHRRLNSRNQLQVFSSSSDCEGDSRARVLDTSKAKLIAHLPCNPW